MPKLIYISEDVAKIAKILNVSPEQIQAKGIVIIECEYLPEATSNEEQIAEQVSATYCIPKCGYYRDAVLRGYIINCFTPNSPILAKLKQALPKI